MKKIFFIFFITFVFCQLFHEKVLAEEELDDYQELYYYDYDEAYEYEDYNSYKDYEYYRSSTEIYDPLEPINRAIFTFNDKLDIYVATPIVRGYRFIVPSWGRKAIRNFLRNLRAPITFFDSVLQGDVANAGKTVTTFAVNSTIGIGGIFDITGFRGFQINDEDFGQTLGKYGIGHGIYLVLPVLGPSSLRDFSGQIVDRAVDPFDYNVFEIGNERELISEPIRWSRYGIELVDKREKYFGIFENVRRTSFDPYATARSAFVQNRAYEIRNGKIINNIDDDKNKKENEKKKSN